MARPATARLKCNPPLGRMPVLQFVMPGELAVDPSYQRGLEESRSKTLIRQIAQHWNWDLCQPLVVARRTGGALFVIDGQHRLEAARLRGDIAQLPCVVVEYACAADEAASFVHLNQQRKPLTKLDLFRAAVASEDPQATAIHRALTEAGLTLAPHSNNASWKPGMVNHIGGIERAWTRDGQAPAIAGLQALAQGFAGQVQRYCGSIYRGLVRVCRDEKNAHGEFTAERFERFVGLLARHSQEEWMKRIKRHFAENPDMFLAEAAETVFREEWRRANGEQSAPKTALAPRNAGEPRAVTKAPGFGLGAGDWKGDEEWAWCAQCDGRRTPAQAAACRSRFCSLREAA